MSYRFFFKLTLCLAWVIGMGLIGMPTVKAGVLDDATEVKVIRKGQTLRFTSARQAVAKAQSGDVIELGTGTHVGPLVLDKANLTLQAKPGVLARVNGNDIRWKPQWKRAPEFGATAWQSPIDFEPVTLSINQRVMIHATESRGGLLVHDNGVGRGGRLPLHSVFTYRQSQRDVIVSFATDINPNQQTIEAAKQGNCAIDIRADHCVVRNLIANGGQAAISLQDTQGSVVEQCLTYGAEAGIRLSHGATQCRVANCDVTWNQDAMSIDCDTNSGLAGDDVWIAHKRFGTYDKWGILLDCAGLDNEIVGNYVYDVWNGIQNEHGVSKDEVAEHYRNHVFKGISKYNIGLKVHHNRIDLTMDDALEPGNELKDNHWYSNLVTRARCAARLKTIEMGPFYFYDNILSQSSDGLRLYKSTPRQATVYIFNNVIDHPDGIIYHKVSDVAWGESWLRKNLKRGTPGFDLFNNIFVSDKPFTSQSSDGVAPNFTSDFNLYTSPHSPGMILRGFDKHSLFNSQPNFADAAYGKFALTSDSVGHDRATNINKRIDHAVNWPTSLPKSTSIGLLNLSPDLRPSGPTSGLWDQVKNELNLGERDISHYRQQPMRWINTRNLQYRIIGQTDNQPIVIELASGNRSRDASFTVNFTDANGKTITHVQGPTQQGEAEATVTIPQGTSMPVTVKLHDQSGADWRVNVIEGDGAVQVDASEKLALRKYDGGAYRFVYHVTRQNQNQPFSLHASKRYHGDFGLVMHTPDGKTQPIDTGQTINPNGQTGSYLFDLTFTKKADIRLQAAEPFLGITNEQPGADLKVRWGKPAF
ncbi:MAG: hypothetical protein CMJ19_23190 [Phycisphaeraceae bacterium]|nr:hypothetical protein [Phycisphaeraceae bacterium]